MAGFNNKRLVFGKLLKVFLYKPVLEPILANAARFAVCHQLIGIKGYFKIKVIVHHHLERPPLYAVALVFVYALAVNASLGAEAVCVNAPAGNELLHKVRRKGFVQLLRNVSERVPQRGFGLRLCKAEAPIRRAAYAFNKFRVFRQSIVQPYGHCVLYCCVVHFASSCLLSVKFAACAFRRAYYRAAAHQLFNRVKPRIHHNVVLYRFNSPAHFVPNGLCCRRKLILAP